MTTMDLPVTTAPPDGDVVPLRGTTEPPERTVVGRLDAILAAFGDGDHALHLSEISKRVGLPKSTVHRLADQLCSVGWLERNSGGYRVGLTLLERGGVALARNPLREAASRHLYPLASSSGLAVQLSILDGDTVVVLDRVTMTGGSLGRVGGREPAHRTAAGKAILAFAPETELAAVLARLPEGGVDPRLVRAELAVVRRTGVALDRGEAYPGVGCVAAAIRSSGQAIGAVSVTGPLERIRRAPSLAHLVRTTALAVWEGRPALTSRALLQAR